MEDDKCNFFTAGFCPYEVFYVENVTKPCPLPHIKSERAAYQTKYRIYPYEKDVLAKYKMIIEDTNKKIEINSSILKRRALDDSHYNALAKCQELIELNPLQNENIEKIHSLLIIHGNLIKSAIKSNDRFKNIKVCNICSSFVEDDSCNHLMCDKYKRLRTIAESLEKKLSGINK